MDFGYLMLVFIAMAAVTFAERALPFAASKWLQKQRCHYGAFDCARRNRRGRGA